MSYALTINREQLSGVVGREVTYQASEEIGKALIRRFAAAMGDRNPLYWDDEYAEKSPYDGTPAPPTLIFELTYDLWSAISEEGLSKEFKEWLGFEVNLQRAGNDYEMVQPVYPDDIISVRRKVIDVTEKQGRKGNFAFLTSEVTYTNQRGELLGINKETLAVQLDES